jgi:hypothetical protein
MANRPAMSARWRCAGFGGYICNRYDMNGMFSLTITAPAVRVIDTAIRRFAHKLRGNPVAVTACAKAQPLFQAG